MRTSAFSTAAFAALLLVASSSTFAFIIHGPVIHPVTGHRYYLLSNATWYDSQTEAMALNGNLVTINDAEENQWVLDNFSNVQGVTRELWIGLNDIATEGTFVWASGEPVAYVNWNTGEPNNNGDEDGVHLYPIGATAPGKWNDAAITRTSLDQPLHGVAELPAANPPVAVTGRAGPVSSTGAQLHGTYTRNGGETFAGFEYGTDTQYGNSVGAVPFIGDTQGSFDLNMDIGGLTPGVVYHYRAVAGNSAGTAYGEDRTFTAGNNPPLAFDDHFQLTPGFGPFPLDVLRYDSDADHDHFTITAVTPGTHGTVAIINNNTYVSYQLTDPSFVGEDSFTYTISDGFASATAEVTVAIPLRDPITNVAFEKNSPVPGAGTDPRIPAGAKFTSFGIPSINDLRQLAFAAQYKSSQGRRSVIVRSDEADVSSVLVQSGDPVPDEDGAFFPLSFRSFKDPLLSKGGVLSFLARFSGPGITTRNDTGIFIESSGGHFRLVAREGDPAPGADDATFRTFLSVALGDSFVEVEDEPTRPVVAFVAQLNEQAGKVTSANDTGLWIYRGALFSDTSLKLVLREGAELDLDPTDQLPGKTIRSFVALQPLPGAADQGHGVAVRYDMVSSVQAKVVFTDASQAIVQIDDLGGIQKANGTGDLANSVLAFKSFGIPTQSAYGQRGFIASLLPAPGSPAGVAARSGVFAANDIDSTNVFPIVFTGEPLPDHPEVQFRQFVNVVIGTTNLVAYTALSSGPGINRTNDLGIWWNGLGGHSLLFQEGTAAPGVEGAKFRNFLSLAMPENGRPLLKARVTRATNAPARPSATRTADGLWYIDRGNTPRLFLLEGQPLPQANDRIVRKVSILENVPGSPTQTRSHNSQSEIIFRAEFKDGSQAVIRAELP